MSAPEAAAISMLSLGGSLEVPFGVGEALSPAQTRLVEIFRADAGRNFADFLLREDWRDSLERGWVVTFAPVEQPFFDDQRWIVGDARHAPNPGEVLGSDSRFYAVKGEDIAALHARTVHFDLDRGTHCIGAIETCALPTPFPEPPPRSACRDHGETIAAAILDADDPEAQLLALVALVRRIQSFEASEVTWLTSDEDLASGEITWERPRPTLGPPTFARDGAVLRARGHLLLAKVITSFTARVSAEGFAIHFESLGLRHGPIYDY